MFHNLTLEHLHQLKVLYRCKHQIQVTTCNGSPVLQIVDGDQTVHLHSDGIPGLSEQDMQCMDLLDVEMYTRAYLPTN